MNVAIARPPVGARRLLLRLSRLEAAYLRLRRLRANPRQLGSASPAAETPTASTEPSTDSAGASQSAAAFDALRADDRGGGGYDRGWIPTLREEQFPGGGWFAGQCAWSSPEAAFLVSVGTSATIRCGW